MERRVGRPLTPWSALIQARLRRGPVEYHKLLTDAADLVPPGRGYRMHLTQREAIAAARGQDVALPTTRREKDAAVLMGRKLVVYNSLRSLVARGKVATYYEDGVKMVRLGDKPW